jgi:hypothetical protein
LYTTRLADGTWMGVTLIARQFGVANFAIQTLLRYRGVRMRTMKEAHAHGKRCKPVRNHPMGNPPSCKCDCGEDVSWNRRKNRWNVYADGHYTLRGPQSPSWKGGTSLLPYTWDWHHISRRMRRRDKQTCRDCGRKFREGDPDLHVHHIDGDKSNNEEGNLACLCRGCHIAEHNRMRARVAYGRRSSVPTR